MKNLLTIIEKRYRELSDKDCHITDGDDVSKQRQKDILFGKVLGYDEVMVIIKRCLSEKQAFSPSFAVKGEIVTSLMQENPDIVFCFGWLQTGEPVIKEEVLHPDKYYVLRNIGNKVIDVYELQEVNDIETLKRNLT